MPTKREPAKLLDLKQAIERTIAEEQGPFANAARAAEIAQMTEFGLAEFTELTGVGVGDWGIYRVGPTGVSLQATESLANFTAGQQNAIHHAGRQLTLAFPCGPALFRKWYDATRGIEDPNDAPGTPGVSDFPLAEGFVGALDAEGGPTAAAHRNSVPASRIIAAFGVKSNAIENKKWWDDRMYSAKKYKLKGARVCTGRALNPSRWDPLQIAVWLIDKGHLPADKVRHAFEASFPEFDSTLL